MIEISVGENGRAFMQKILRQCEGDESKLAAITSKPGRVFAPLPADVSEQRAQEFETGGVSSLRSGLQWLCENLQSKSPGVLIFHDVWAQPSDFSVRLPLYKNYFKYGKHVYFYIHSMDINLENLVQLHKQIVSFQSVAFYVARTVALPAGFTKELSTSVLEDMLGSVTAVYVSAYDQESWIVWEAVA